MTAMWDMLSQIHHVPLFDVFEFHAPLFRGVLNDGRVALLGELQGLVAQQYPVADKAIAVEAQEFVGDVLQRLLPAERRVVIALFSQQERRSPRLVWSASPAPRM